MQADTLKEKDTCVLHREKEGGKKQDHRVTREEKELTLVSRQLYCFTMLFNHHACIRASVVSSG